jgi:hypothetical protein
MTNTELKLEFAALGAKIWGELRPCWLLFDPGQALPNCENWQASEATFAS